MESSIFLASRFRNWSPDSYIPIFWVYTSWFTPYGETFMCIIVNRNFSDFCVYTSSPGLQLAGLLLALLKLDCIVLLKFSILIPNTPLPRYSMSDPRSHGQDQLPFGSINLTGLSKVYTYPPVATYFSASGSTPYHRLVTGFMYLAP